MHITHTFQFPSPPPSNSFWVDKEGKSVRGYKHMTEKVVNKVVRAVRGSEHMTAQIFTRCGTKTASPMRNKSRKSGSTVRGCKHVTEIKNLP